MRSRHSFSCVCLDLFGDAGGKGGKGKRGDKGKGGGPCLEDVSGSTSVLRRSVCLLPGEVRSSFQDSLSVTAIHPKPIKP